MKILAIDPSSNKAKTSTSGIVYLDNAKLINHWAVDYGVKNFRKWASEIGQHLQPDVVVVEKFELRDGSADNSVLETISEIMTWFPSAVLFRNAGYASDIPNELLKELNLYKFSKSHHQDIRAAARLALFWAMRNDIQEVIDDIGGQLEFNTKKLAN